jgi:small subunit ribosomal protein S11
MKNEEELKEKGKANDEEAPKELEEGEEENDEEEKSEEKKIKKKEKEIEAVLNIYTSFNNTIAHVTDASGRTIAKVSGGMVTKHSRLKANPTIAMFIAKRISETMKDRGIKSLYVKIRAKTGNTSPGSGANAIIKSLSRDGFKILNILDNTRMPRGGPKKKGGRRGRRV